MNKKNLIKRVLAGIFYLVGISFAQYFISIILNRNVTLSISGLIIITIGVCIPSLLATFLIVTTIDQADKKHKIIKTFISLVFIFYTLILIDVLFLGMRHYMYTSTINNLDYIKWNTNLIPFKTVSVYLYSFVNHSMNSSIAIVNLFGNILLFAPMGMLLPCIFQNLRKFKKFLFVMVIILISVEIGQLITHSGSCDIDDVILNLIGATLFYGLWNLDFIQSILRKMFVLNNSEVM